MGKRKYPKVQGWWVYSIKVPSINKYYIGISGAKNCWQRWNKGHYVGKALEPYLDEWDNLIKTVIKDGLTETEALKMEDDLIQALRFIDLCINKQRSGLITNDAKQYYENNKEYHKQYYENNKVKKLEQHKQRYQTDAEFREREKQRVKQWQKDNREKLNEQQRERRSKKKLEKQQHTVVD